MPCHNFGMHFVLCCQVSITMALQTDIVQQYVVDACEASNHESKCCSAVCLTDDSKVSLSVSAANLGLALCR